MFVAVGDALTTADGLASPALRAALVAVLSRTPGVTVSGGQQDYQGRPALRADFVDERNRPHEVQSMYFDPTTYQLLESRDSTDPATPVDRGPSAAYTAHPSGTAAPGALTGPAFVAVTTTEQVVTTLPDTTGCVVN